MCMLIYYNYIYIFMSVYLLTRCSSPYGYQISGVLIWWGKRLLLWDMTSCVVFTLRPHNSIHFLFYFTLTMDINQCWKWPTIRLFFCPPPFQPSQCWLHIVVVMLICSMLEINDHVVLYCIVRMHLQGLYQHVIPRNLFAYKVILLLLNINRMVVTVVHMLQQ